MRKEPITQGQLMLYLILFFYSTMVGFESSHLIKSAQYDGPLVLIIAGCGGLLVAFLTIKFAERRPNEFFVHYGKEILPYWIHLFFMGILFFAFLHTSAYVLREYEDFIVQTYLSETPNWAVGVLLGLVVAISVRLGVKTIFRTAQGLFFMIIVADLLNTILIGKELRWERWIAFITNHNGHGIFVGSYSITPLFGQVMIILFFFPFISQKHKTLKSVSWAIFLSVLWVIINFINLLLLFGPNLASHITYPMLELVRFIKIAGFIENLDPFLIAIWSTTVYLKITLLFYTACLILAQLFHLKDHRPFVFSLAAVMVALSLQMSGGSAALTRFFEESWATFFYFIILIPIFYFLVDTIKRTIKKKSMDN